MAWWNNAWNDITRSVNSLPGAGVLGQIGGDIGGFLKSQQIPGPQAVVGGSKAPTFGNAGQYLQNLPNQVGLGGGGGGGKPADPASPPPNPEDSLAQFIAGNVPKLTEGQLYGPGAETWAQKTAALLRNMTPAEANKVMSALPQGSDARNDLQSILQPSSAQNLYGFDPLSMANIFSQSFAPYIQANQNMMQGDIANYSKMMQQAMGQASPQMRQAFAVSEPAVQQAQTLENQAGANSVVNAPAIDSLIQNLSNATNAAKAAGQYASIAPYYSSLIAGTGVIGGTPGATTAGTATSPLTTPFTYGSPAATQTALAQQNLLGLAQSASQG